MEKEIYIYVYICMYILVQLTFDCICIRNVDAVNMMNML